MLQQTQVAAVIPYFDRFIRRFPTLRALARADPQAVLKAWQGLGYYARARNLQAAARRIVRDHAGRLPSTYDALIALPGIGAYTAGAVLSIAFGQPVPAVDGNVVRVMTRFWGLPAASGPAQAARRIGARLHALIPAGQASAFNQALMEVGALLCKPRHPVCARCPLQPECHAWRDHRTERPPRAAPARRIPHYRVAVGVIWRGRRLLLAQRRFDQMLGGLWELPGGKRQGREPLRDTARREIDEETGLRVDVGRAYGTVRHAYSHFRVTLAVFPCAVRAGTPRPRAALRLRWVTPAQARRLPLPRATEKALALVRD